MPLVNYVNTFYSIVILSHLSRHKWCHESASHVCIMHTDVSSLSYEFMLMRYKSGVHWFWQQRTKDGRLVFHNYTQITYFGATNNCVRSRVGWRTGEASRDHTHSLFRWKRTQCQKSRNLAFSVTNMSRCLDYRSTSPVLLTCLSKTWCIRPVCWCSSLVYQRFSVYALSTATPYWFIWDLVRTSSLLDSAHKKFLAAFRHKSYPWWWQRLDADWTIFSCDAYSKENSLKRLMVFLGINDSHCHIIIIAMVRYNRTPI